MKNLATLGCSIDEINCAVGAPTGEVVLSAIPFPGFADTLPTRDSNSLEIQRVFAAYLSNIWQSTVGRNLWSTAADPYPFNSNQINNLFDSEVKMLVVNIDSTSPSKRSVIGTPNIQNYGYLAFTYPTGTGPLQPIRWDNGAYFPESADCHGYKVFPRPGVSGTTQVLYDIPGLQPYEVFGLNGLNFNDNLFTGLSNHRGAYDAIQAAVSANFTVPYKTTGDPVLDSKLFNYQPAICNSTDNTEYNNHAVMMAYITEIWEYFLAKHHINGSDFLALLTGTGKEQIPGMYLRSANLQCITSRIDSDVTYGIKDLPYYGCVAAIYIAGMGEIRYLNDANTSFVPEQPGCLGFAYYLKPGVRMTAVQKLSSGIATGITAVGKISFIDGIINGFRV